MTKEERKEYNKKYYQEHKEYYKQYDKQYKQEHREEILEYNRQYNQDHSEEKKQYYQDHKEEKKQYYQDHKEYYKQYDKQYYQTKPGRAKHLASSNNHNDLEKGFDISSNVDAQWIVDNIFSGQVCTYCGETDWKKLGVDRIDNSLPHIDSNLVPCCQRCNCSRQDRRTVEEHIEYTKSKYEK